MRVRQVFYDELNMGKVCAKMAPKNLSQDQEDKRKNSDVMERLIT